MMRVGAFFPRSDEAPSFQGDGSFGLQGGHDGTENAACIAQWDRLPAGNMYKKVIRFSNGIMRYNIIGVAARFNGDRKDERCSRG